MQFNFNNKILFTNFSCAQNQKLGQNDQAICLSMFASKNCESIKSISATFSEHPDRKHITKNLTKLSLLKSFYLTFIQNCTLTVLTSQEKVIASTIFSFREVLLQQNPQGQIYLTQRSQKGSDGGGDGGKPINPSNPYPVTQWFQWKLVSPGQSLYIYFN